MFAPVGLPRPAGIGLPAAATACASSISVAVRRSATAAPEVRGLTAPGLDT